MARGVAAVIGYMYWRLNRQRRGVVIENLRPLTANQNAAFSLSRALFLQFARKIVDLWRYECGWPVEQLATELTGWDHFLAAQKSGRGILLVTVHVGNWELGAPLLTRRGVRVCVITLQEPQSELTELRKAARMRWGIETLVIGQDPFAFVDVIRQLEAGATVALLMDRPPATNAAEVELFGRPFRASLAAAELARASGCALLPVCLPHAGTGYRADILPEIRYDRAALGKRETRITLTQEILRVFEPLIRQYASQWYHFVPIWPPASSNR
jgi:KDO2-lipid IV(A) lauroyltransferase